MFVTYVIAERLRSYWNQTRPLLDYYRKQGILYTIDGRGSPDEVFERIKEAVRTASGGSANGDRPG